MSVKSEHMSNFLDFKTSRPYTLGVELELQLIDPESLDLTPAAPSLMAKLPDEFKERIKPEFIRSMVEIASLVNDNIGELADDLKQSITALEKLAGKSGCMIFASSLHPFAPYRQQQVSPGERYAALMEELQLSGRRLITQGLHVHVGLTDGPTAIKVCNSIRQYLPLLLALTASSPFYGGEDTGFYSYRSRLLDALARAGLPHPFDDWQDFQDLLRTLKRTGIISDIRDIWWDVRPHPDLGTIEIRICDLPVRFDEILAIAGLVQSLVKTLAEKKERHEHPPLELIATNKWQAARHGLEGIFIDHGLASDPLSIREAIERLILRTSDAAAQLGCQKIHPILKRMLETGNSAHRIREIYTSTGSFEKVISRLQREFWN
jgi:carboxylate-amine ligase